MKGRIKRSVLNPKPKPKKNAKMRYEDSPPPIGQTVKRRPSRPASLDLGFRFCLSFLVFNQNLKQKPQTNSSSSPKREPGPWRPPQLQTPGRLYSQTTTRRKHANNMPLMPVNTASTTAAERVAHGSVSHRIECCCTI